MPHFSYMYINMVKKAYLFGHQYRCCTKDIHDQLYIKDIHDQICISVFVSKALDEAYAHLIKNECNI